MTIPKWNSWNQKKILMDTYHWKYWTSNTNFDVPVAKHRHQTSKSKWWGHDTSHLHAIIGPHNFNFHVWFLCISALMLRNHTSKSNSTLGTFSDMPMIKNSRKTVQVSLFLWSVLNKRANFESWKPGRAPELHKYFSKISIFYSKGYRKLTSVIKGPTLKVSFNISMKAGTNKSTGAVDRLENKIARNVA